jgi:hypothetical protein
MSSNAGKPVGHRYVGGRSSDMAGVRAILPNQEPYAPGECLNIAPIAVVLSGDGKAVAVKYLPCGSEYVQGVAVTDAVSGEPL